MTEDCPTCGKECETENGMKNHHAKIHGESLVLEEYECEWCGEIFENYPSQQKLSNKSFCSNDCRGKWQSEQYELEGNPGCLGTVEVGCRRCGNIRELPKGRAFSEYGDHGYDLEDQHEIQSCIACRGEVEYQNRIPFGNEWEETSNLIRERDGNQCQWCGVSNKEHQSRYGKSLHVHHITPRRHYFDSESGELSEKADRSSNLITLCKPHHEEAECGEISTRSLKSRI